MTKEYDQTAQDFHAGWISLDDKNHNVFNTFGDGKDATDAPILMDDHWVSRRISKLEGKMLTLIEAILPAKQQEGAKSMVRDFASQAHTDVIEATHTPEYSQYMIDLCNGKIDQ